MKTENQKAELIEQLRTLTYELYLEGSRLIEANQQADESLFSKVNEIRSIFKQD
jgi:hypothetical protein